MMKLSKRESRLVSMALLAVVIFIYYMYFLAPKIDEYINIKQEMEQKQQELGTLQTAESKLTKLLDSIDNDKREITQLEEIVPSSKKLPDIIVRMERLSQETSLELREITFDASTEDADKNRKENAQDVQDQGYADIPVKLSLVGTYHQILDFLRSVEETERIYSVRSINLAREYEVAQDSIGVEIELSTYAVKHDGKLLDDPVTYEFMDGTYGREDPFKPLPEEMQSYTVEPSANSRSSTGNIPSEGFIEDMMERLFDQILKDLTKE